MELPCTNEWNGRISPYQGQPHLWLGKRRGNWCLTFSWTFRIFRYENNEQRYASSELQRLQRWQPLFHWRQTEILEARASVLVLCCSDGWTRTPELATNGNRPKQRRGICVPKLNDHQHEYKLKVTELTSTPIAECKECGDTLEPADIETIINTWQNRTYWEKHRLPPTWGGGSNLRVVVHSYLPPIRANLATGWLFYATRLTFAYLCIILGYH